MNQTINEEEAIKQYLLGRLSEEERTALEERLLTDDDFFERLNLAEDELIEEYLAGALPAGDRERFVSHFMGAPERQRKLGFSMALRKYVTTRTLARDIADSSAIATRFGAHAETGQQVNQNQTKLIGRPSAWTRLASSSYFRMAACLIVVFGAGFGIWRAFIYQSDLEKGFAALQGAYLKERPLEARLTGLRNYAPHLVTRGGETGPVDEREVERAELHFREAVRSHSDAATDHGLGEIYLAEKKFDRSVEYLQRAVEAAPTDARYHADLGAALLEKGGFDISAGQSAGDDELAGKGSDELAQGLQQLSKALELNPSLLEALFNRALADERMNLRSQAAEDWQQYLEKDGRSKWADEARERLRELQQKSEGARSKEQLLGDFLSAFAARDSESAWRTYSRSRFRTGSSVAESLLDDYLRLAVQCQSVGARAKLAPLSYAAELDARRAGDFFLSELSAYYRATSVSKLASVARARELRVTGLKEYDRGNVRAAVDLYTRAFEIFQRVDDRCEQIGAEYLLCHCLLAEYKLKLGLLALEKLAGKCDVAGYRWLKAQVIFAKATAETGLNDYSVAVGDCKRCLAISEEISDIRTQVTALQQLGQIYSIMNNCQRSLGVIGRSMALDTTYPSELMQRWADYFFTALSLDRLGRYCAAVACQKEALSLAIEVGRPQLECRSRMVLGLLYAHFGDYVGAMSTALAAAHIAQSFADERVKSESMAYSSLKLGDLRRWTGDYEHAAESYREALRLYQELGSPAFRYVAHKGKLLCGIAAGDDESVEEDLAAALELFEQYRATILEQSLRDRFFDTEQDTYDIAIHFAFSKKKDPVEAFNYSERCRARTLVDLSIADGEGDETQLVPISESREPLKLEEIQRQLPADVEVVQYSVLQDRLLTWVVSKSGFWSREREITAHALTEKVNEYLSDLSSSVDSDGEVAKGRGRELFSILVQPVQSLLDSTKQICVVPDKVLHLLPFAALISPTSDKYLVDEYTLISSPSSNILVVASEAARKREGHYSERLLSVGDPSFDGKLFPGLESLPSARSEAEAIAAIYGAADSALTGEKATKIQVQAKLRASDVAHIAAHLVTDEYASFRSGLVLGKSKPADSGDRQRRDGMLQMYEICHLALPRTRLVVLSACRSGVEGYGSGRGMVGIARAFLAAGVPLVVATSWAAESNASERLMINFHKHRKIEGSDAADALRNAQTDMLHGASERFRAPYYWAPFIAIGGYAQY
jgi:CHAT domain-containing protein/tetratricopeptide (TPR) repeat protein